MYFLWNFRKCISAAKHNDLGHQLHLLLLWGMHTEYIGKKINEDIQEVSRKCHAFVCEEILDIGSIMPIDFLIQVRDANWPTKVPTSPLIIDCPFMDCMCKLIDDHQKYPIRACLECWKLLDVNCKCSHFGMTYENYQFSILAATLWRISWWTGRGGEGRGRGWAGGRRRSSMIKNIDDYEKRSNFVSLEIK